MSLAVGGGGGQPGSCWLNFRMLANMAKGSQEQPRKRQEQPKSIQEWPGGAPGWIGASLANMANK